MYFGNEAINEADGLVLEIEVPNNLISIISESGVIHEDLQGKIFIDDIKVMFNDKSNASMSGKSSELQHGCRIKVLAPKDCNGMEITINNKGEVSLNSGDPRSSNSKCKKTIKPAIKFAEKYSKELLDIWKNTDREDLQVKALTTIVNDSKVTVKASSSQGKVF